MSAKVEPNWGRLDALLQFKATLAYNEMALKHYGEFAKLNEIEND